MSGPKKRLAALGLALPPVTPPVAAYVPALRTGPYVYVSGQVPVTDGELAGTGKVGSRGQHRGRGPDGPYLCAERDRGRGVRGLRPGGTSGAS